jgi:DNA invertase Pin-like site-specific DNA recombinase
MRKRSGSVKRRLSCTQITPARSALRSSLSRMFFQIPGAVAESEHALMSERTHDGLDAARARGRTEGQKPKLTARQAKVTQEMYDDLGSDE